MNIKNFLILWNEKIVAFLFEYQKFDHFKIYYKLRSFSINLKQWLKLKAGCLYWQKKRLFLQIFKKKLQIRIERWLPWDHAIFNGAVENSREQFISWKTKITYLLYRNHFLCVMFVCISEAKLLEMYIRCLLLVHFNVPFFAKDFQLTLELRILLEHTVGT